MENELFSEDKKEILSSEEVEVLSEFSSKLSKYFEHCYDVLPENVPIQGFQNKSSRDELTAILSNFKNDNIHKLDDKCISGIDSLLSNLAEIDRHFNSKEQEKPSVLKQLSQIKAQPKAEIDSVQKHSSRNEVSI